MFGVVPPLEAWSEFRLPEDDIFVNARNLITILSLMVLVGTEVFAVAIAAGWAIAGLFDLGDTVGHVLMGLFSLFAAWIMLQLWQRATHVEPLALSETARR